MIGNFVRDGAIYLRKSALVYNEVEWAGKIHEDKGNKALVWVDSMQTAMTLAAESLERGSGKSVTFFNLRREAFGELVKGSDGRHHRWDEDLTEYRLEFYEKGKRKPYDTVVMNFPSDLKETFTNSKNCFNFKLSHCIRAKVFINSTGELVATTYLDKNGNRRLQWIGQGAE